MQHYAEAARLNPGFTEARYRLAIQLAEHGRVAEALPEFQAVTAQKPDFAEAHFNYGVALAKSGQFDAAIVQFRETLRLQPNHARAREFLDKALALRAR